MSVLVPIWIVVFDRDGRQLTIVRCRYQSEADGVLFHNAYYGYRCLRINVKEWK